MRKKINVFIENNFGIIFVIILFVTMMILIAAQVTKDKKMIEQQSTAEAKTISLYEHIDPQTGVCYYIYEGNMYPRVKPDGSYYSIQEKTQIEEPMTPVSSNYVIFKDERYETETSE